MPSLRETWWRFKRPTPQLYAAIAPLKRVLVVAGTSRTLAFAFVPKGLIFSHATYVFALDSGGDFAVLQSAFHESWARNYSSTMKGDLRYTNTDVFETFPFPTLTTGCQLVGDAYHQFRRGVMTARQEGLTKTYNRYHDPEEKSTDIKQLRQLHVEMDKSVAAAYGWTDLDLGHGFHETKQGIRHTISEPARREILARLLKLNHERYTEEDKQGLHDSKAKKGAGGGKRKLRKALEPVAATANLFYSVVDTAFPSTERDRFLCGLLCDLVAAQQGLEPTAYLDAIVIALRYKRHGGLLIGNERKQFTKLSGVLPVGYVQSADKIPWRDMLEILSRQDALHSDGNHLEPGSRFDDVRKAYPTCDPSLIELIHKAAATLRELQSSAKPDTEQELPIFREDLQALYGGSP